MLPVFEIFAPELYNLCVQQKGFYEGKQSNEIISYL